MIAHFLNTTCSSRLPWHVTLCCNRTNYETPCSKAPVIFAPPFPMLTLSCFLVLWASSLHFALHVPPQEKARYWSSPVNVAVKVAAKSSNEYSPKNRRALLCGVPSCWSHTFLTPCLILRCCTFTDVGSLSQ